MLSLRERVERRLQRATMRAASWRPVGLGFWIYHLFTGRLRSARELVYTQDKYGDWWYRYEA